MKTDWSVFIVMSVAVNLRKFKSVLISQFSSFRLFCAVRWLHFISRTSRLFGADIVIDNCGEET